MIPSNPNPPMSKEEIRQFLLKISRRIKGEVSPNERENFESAKRSYESYMKLNGGKNPILG